MVRPLLHHLAPLRQVRRSVVGAPARIPYSMGQLVGKEGRLCGSWSKRTAILPPPGQCPSIRPCRARLDEQTPAEPNAERSAPRTCLHSRPSLAGFRQGISVPSSPRSASLDRGLGAAQVARRIALATSCGHRILRDASLRSRASFRLTSG